MFSNSRERGAALIVSLVFLLVFLVMALSIFRGASTSSQAIGNMQWRNEAISAANESIDRLLSTANVANQAANVTAQVNATPFQYDMSGDGVVDVRVNFPVVTLDGVARAGPRCLRLVPIPPTQLSPNNPQDAGCFASSSSGGTSIQQGGGATPAAGSPSLCSNSDWMMTVRANDPSTSTNVDVVQGFSVRVLTTAVLACN